MSRQGPRIELRLFGQDDLILGVEDEDIEIRHARRDARPLVHHQLQQHGRVRLVRRRSVEDPDGKVERVGPDRLVGEEHVEELELLLEGREGRERLRVAVPGLGQDLEPRTGDRHGDRVLPPVPGGSDIVAEDIIVAAQDLDVRGQLPGVPNVREIAPARRLGKGLQGLALLILQLPDAGGPVRPDAVRVDREDGRVRLGEKAADLRARDPGREVDDALASRG